MNSDGRGIIKEEGLEEGLSILRSHLLGAVHKALGEEERQRYGERAIRMLNTIAERHSGIKVAWVIQAETSHGPMYWIGEDKYPWPYNSWSKNKNEAIQFKREKDALAVVNGFGWDNKKYRVIEEGIKEELPPENKREKRKEILLEAASKQNGQGAIVAKYILGMYDGTEYKVDLSDLRALDHGVARAILEEVCDDCLPRSNIHIRWGIGEKGIEKIRKMHGIEKDSKRQFEKMKEIVEMAEARGIEATLDYVYPAVAFDRSSIRKEIRKRLTREEKIKNVKEEGKQIERGEI